MFRKKVPLSVYDRTGPEWPVYIVSLKTSTDRRAAISAQCDELGISPTFIDAIDGRAGLPEDLEPLVDRAAIRATIGREASDGECACALSHQMAYQRLLDDGHAGAVILEDDAVLTPNFHEFYFGRCYQTTDFIQLDHNRARAYIYGHQTWSPTITLVPLVENAYLATGYSVSRAAAEFIRGQSQPLHGLADWPCDLTPLSPMAALPFTVQSPPNGNRESLLEAERKRLTQEHVAKHGHIVPKNDVDLPRGPARLFKRAYWRRWVRKHLTIRIS